METGLILEGGAMRGLFSAGVMDVMMENGIQFDGIIGVSAGAAFGVNYKSGQMGTCASVITRGIATTSAIAASAPFCGRETCSTRSFVTTKYR